MGSEELTIKDYRHDAVFAPEAVILLIHGLGEHAGRYNEWAKRFTDSGVSLRLFDLPGHGLSGGKRGVMPEFERIYDIIEGELASMKKENPGVPLFLYGHSLGGAIVLSYLVRRKPEVSGAIVTSPWVKLSMQPSGVKVTLSRFLNKLMPDITLASGLDSNYLSHDTDVIKAYNNDPLVHGLISPRLFCEVEKAASDILNHSASIEMPLLLVHGRDDMITSPSGSIEVASGAAKAILKLWEGGYHELHNEPVKDDHFNFIREWMDTVIS